MTNFYFKMINFLLYMKHFRLVLKFKKRVGYYPDISNPKKYHEMMLWRKLFDHNPIFQIFCDKIAAKEYAKSVLPDAEFPETLWVGEDIGDAPEELLGSDVVLKASHGSSTNYIGAIGAGNLEDVRKMTRAWIKKDYGRSKHEWGYFGGRKRLFLERRLRHDGDGELVDVSVRCADGVPILASAITGNKTPLQKDGYFDLDGKRCPRFESKCHEDKILPADFKLPASFPTVIDYARRLSVGVDYARFDFLCVGDHVYPGEITVYPGSGLSQADDDGIDALIVCNWDLGSSWFLRTPQSGWRGAYAAFLRKHRSGFRRRSFAATALKTS